ncbi:hypothetical protein [Phaeobacter sp. NW0010-22]|uniref:hypothetical protein n=1 Tax=Phaeobacter sp. NW0010-22 TaxID=3135907 RepID=UPI00310A42C4
MRAAVLAVDRDALASDVPPFAEQGYDFPIVSSPIVLYELKGVAPEITTGIEGAVAEIVAEPEFAEFVTAKGTLPLYRTGAEIKAAVRAMQNAVTSVINALKSN